MYLLVQLVIPYPIFSLPLHCLSLDYGLVTSVNQALKTKLMLPSEHWGGALVAKIFSTGAAVTVQPWAAILFFFGHLVVGTEGFLQSGPF